MQFGSTFRCDYQEIKVNCCAKSVDDDDWKKLGIFTVNYGENWYYGRLRHRYSVSDEYLIRDDVGRDGWGSVLICRNVKLIDNAIPNVIPQRLEPVTW